MSRNLFFWWGGEEIFLFSPVVLVVDVVRDVLKVLHVGLDEEPLEVGKVAVLRVLDVHDAPGVLPAPDLLAGHLEGQDNRDSVVVRGSLYGFRVRGTLELQALTKTENLSRYYEEL